jgi:hypothetical protein
MESSETLFALGVMFLFFISIKGNDKNYKKQGHFMPEKDLQQLEEDRQNEQFPIMIALLVAAAVAIFHFENM